MPLADSFLIVAHIETNPIVVDGPKAIDYALTNRMELRQKEISIETSVFDLMQAKTTNEFAGQITASFGVTSNNENFGELFNNSERTPTVGLTFEVPLFDWGERKAEIRAAEATLESAEIDLANESIDIEVNLRQVLRNLENLRNQIEIQQKTVDNAQLTYEINYERYLNGDLTSLDLGIYQNQLSDKKMAHTNAIINYKLELLNLKIQSLYDFELEVPVIPQEFLEVEDE